MWPVNYEHVRNFGTTSQHSSTITGASQAFNNLTLVSLDRFIATISKKEIECIKTIQNKFVHAQD